MQQDLRMKEFSPIWCNWVQGFVQGGNAGIKVNGQLRPYFKTRKGLREGDSLSPILFNIVVDMLAITIARAKEDDQIKGILPHFIEDGSSLLKYVDDTNIFMHHDIEQTNMKLHL